MWSYRVAIAVAMLAFSVVGCSSEERAATAAPDPGLNAEAGTAPATE